jgi:glycosyltransferase involved in cell wall biosynthesis
MISILCPSRGRPTLLAESIGSLRDQATTSLELLVAADEDDSETVQVARGLDATVVVSERVGYSNLHVYYNGLAKQASGDWLLLWNDDATMLTASWDRAIEGLPAGVLVADLQSYHSPDLCCFPAVRYVAVTAVGGFSPHTPHCDTYWQDLGRATETIRSVDVHVRHDRFDVNGMNHDQTYLDGQAGYRSAEYYSEFVQSAISVDVDKIRGIA